MTSTALMKIAARTQCGTQSCAAQGPLALAALNIVLDVLESFFLGYAGFSRVFTALELRCVLGFGVARICGNMWNMVGG